jgi:DNA-binding transcriptional ArsR family regulator
VENETVRRTRISDARTLRALAHPARIAILGELHAGGAGTATGFAELCGLSPSATSYHLRALAKAGLVEQAPGRGDGRERLWQAVGGPGLEIATGPEADAETQLAEQELIELLISRDEARARAWLARWHQESPEWYEAANVNSASLMITAEELTELNEKVTALLEPFARRARKEPPAGARRVEVVYRSIPEG